MIRKRRPTWRPDPEPSDGWPAFVRLAVLAVIVCALGALAVTVNPAMGL